MVRNWLLRIQKPFLIVLASMPIMLLLGAEHLSSSPWQWYLLPLLYTGMAILCLLPRGKHRITFGIASAVIMTCSALYLLPWQEHLLLLATLLMYVVLLFIFLGMGGWTPSTELPPYVPIAGFTLYTLISLYTGIQADRWAMMRGHLNVCFLVFLLLTMLYLNRLSVQQAMVDDKSKPPAILRRRNLLMTVLFFFMVVLISLIPVIGETLIRAWDWLKEAVAAVIRWLTPAQTDAVGAIGDGEMDFSMFAETASEPNALAQLLEKIFRYAALVIAVAVAIFAVIFLSRKLVRLLRRMLRNLKLFSEAAQEDFEDTSIDTRNDDDPVLSRRGRKHRLKHGRIDHPSDPRLRIRSIYRVIRNHHEDWKPGTTARDTLPPEAASIYEKARYSNHAVQESEAASFADSTRNL